MVGYGYRHEEVPLDPPGETKKHVLEATAAPRDASFRPGVLVSLGCHVSGVAPPKPDLSDAPTAEAGVRKRFLAQPPIPNPEKLKDLKRFVVDWVGKNLVPLDSFADTSVETWLAKCNYPAYRKAELLNLWQTYSGVLTKRDGQVKSFIKDETYISFKHARAINSRTDLFKCYVGPIFRLIEEQVYKLPNFIKKIPVADRPKYIVEQLERLGCKYFEGDFTAYESHFTREMMEALEFPLYEYMSKHLPNGVDWMKVVRDVIGGENHCVFKWFTVDVDATRMSGEMCTSIGNGFSTLMLLLYLFNKLNEEVNPMVEGDDSGTSFMNACPTPADFAELGFTIKAAVRDNISEMSFCGIIFDRQDMINVTDPLDVLANFGWAGRSYVHARPGRLRELLRCKSLSYAHQYPGCPIIQSLAQYGLRATRSVDVRHFIENDRGISLWERGQLRDAFRAVHHAKVPLMEVPIATRLLVERMYGISVAEQRRLEEYLDGLTEIQPLTGPVSELSYHKDFYDYSERFVDVVFSRDRLDYPSGPWYKFVPSI